MKRDMVQYVCDGCGRGISFDRGSFGDIQLAGWISIKVEGGEGYNLCGLECAYKLITKLLDAEKKLQSSLAEMPKWQEIYATKLFGGGYAVEQRVD
jgi:hypothetical protein